MEKLSIDLNKNINLIKKTDEKLYDTNIQNSVAKEYVYDFDIVNQFGIAKKKEELDNNILRYVNDESIEKTAIFVPMDYYHVSNNDENMFTFGIGSCCGLFISNESISFLMHISPKFSAEKIFSLLKYLNLSNCGEVYIFPGSACQFGKGGNLFDYQQLANKLEFLNNNIYIRTFNSISGSVYFLENKLIVDDGEQICIKDFKKSSIIRK